MEKKISLVTIGETGVGKSQFSNMLLGRPEFLTGDSIEAVTQAAKTANGTLLGRNSGVLLSVTDTQGYNDPGGKDYENC